MAEPNQNQQQPFNQQPIDVQGVLGAIDHSNDEAAAMKQVAGIPDKYHRIMHGIALGLTPMVSEDNSDAQLVPASKLADAKAAKYRTAIVMADTDNKPHLVAHEDAAEAVKNGWTAGQPVTGAGEKPGLISRAWNWATTPNISTKDILSHVTIAPGGVGPMGQGFGYTAPGLGQSIQEKIDEANAPHPDDSTAKNWWRSYGANAVGGGADVLNTMYNTPLGIATLGAEPLGEMVGAKVAMPIFRAGSKALNSAFAGQGLSQILTSEVGPKDILQAIKYGTYTGEKPENEQVTPENIQNLLQGTAMLSQGLHGGATGGEEFQEGAKAAAVKARQYRQAVRELADPSQAGPVPAATMAWRPRNSKYQWKQQADSALQDMKREAVNNNVDIDSLTIQQALELAGSAKREIWNELETNFLGPNETAAANTSPVADTIRSTISQRMREQNPGLVERIEAVASTYDGRDIDLRELENRIQELNNETRAIEARHPADKRAAQASPDNAYVFAERNALRNILDSKLNELTGPGAQQLKSRYGALSSVEDVIQRRIPVAERAAPESLHSILTKAYAGAKIVGGLVTGSPVHVAEGATALALQKRAAKLNDPNYLTQEALRQAEARPDWTPNPRPAPTPTPKQGVLPFGPGSLWSIQQTPGQPTPVPAPPAPQVTPTQTHLPFGPRSLWEIRQTPPPEPKPPQLALPPGQYEMPPSTEFPRRLGPARPHELPPSSLEPAINPNFPRIGRRMPEEKPPGGPQGPTAEASSGTVPPPSTSPATRPPQGGGGASPAAATPTSEAGEVLRDIHNVPERTLERRTLSQPPPDERQLDLGMNLPRRGEPFFSKAEQVATAKLPKSGTGESFLATLRNNGVKAEEIADLKLDEFAKKPKVTKQEFVQAIKDRRPQLEQTMLGEGASDQGDPLYEGYITPGGSHYRETLTQYPQSDAGAAAQSFKEEADYREREMNDEIDRHNNASPEDQEAYGDYFDKERQAIKNLRDQQRMAEAEARRTDYRSGHWVEHPNVLMHSREGDFQTADGMDVRHVHEWQSDLHQKGRESGYRSPGDERAGGPAFPDTRAPNAPFKKSWHELAVKDSIRRAIEDGKQGMTWDTGETQADRYDLAKQVERIEYDPHTETLNAYDHSGKRVIDENVKPDELKDHIGKEAAEKLHDKIDDYYPPSDENDYSIAYDPETETYEVTDPNGEKIGEEETHRDAQRLVEDYVEHERNTQELPTLRGLDLKVGGEGMSGFYDKIVPDFVRKYTKKWGAKVDTAELPTGDTQAEHEYVGPELTRDEVEKRSTAAGSAPVEWKQTQSGSWAWFKNGKQVSGAFPDVSESRTASRTISADPVQRQLRDVLNEMNRGVPFKDAMAHSPELAHELGGEIQTNRTPMTTTVHRLTFTPEMVKAIQEEGQPLYSKKKGGTTDAEVRNVVELLRDTESSIDPGDENTAAHIRINDAGQKFLSHATKSNWLGINWHGADGPTRALLFRRLADSLERAHADVGGAEAAQNLRNLADQIDQVHTANYDPNAGHAGIPIVRDPEATAHERDIHGGQRAFDPEGNVEKFTNIEKTMDHPAVPIAAARLNEAYGRELPPHELVAEMQAHILDGSHENLGLSQEQALDFMEHSARVFEEHHGAEAVANAPRLGRRYVQAMRDYIGEGNARESAQSAESQTPTQEAQRGGAGGSAAEGGGRGAAAGEGAPSGLLKVDTRGQEEPTTVGGRATVETARLDNIYWNKAKEALGPNASFSQISAKALDLKAKAAAAGTLESRPLEPPSIPGFLRQRGMAEVGGERPTNPFEDTEGAAETIRRDPMMPQHPSEGVNPLLRQMQGGGLEARKLAAPAAPEGKLTPEEKVAAMSEAAGRPLGEVSRPEELAGIKTQQTLDNAVRTLQQMPRFQEFLDMSQRGAGERKWYQRGRQALAVLPEVMPDYFKGAEDVDRFTDVLASFSPRQAVKSNLKEALGFWKSYVDAGRPSAWDQVSNRNSRVFDGEKMSSLEKLLWQKTRLGGGKVPNAMKAFRGIDLWPDLTKNEAFKVPSFTANLKGFLDRVTSDGWMAAFTDISPEELSDPHSYHPLAMMTRLAAKELGWEPAEAQAAIWSVVKTFRDKGPDWATPEKIREYSTDFADILKNDKETRRIMTAMGADPSAISDQIDRNVEAKPEIPEGLGPTSEHSLRQLAARLKLQSRESANAKLIAKGRNIPSTRGIIPEPRSGVIPSFLRQPGYKPATGMPLRPMAPADLYNLPLSRK